MDELLTRNRNVNRGYRKLRAWLRAIDLYGLICPTTQNMPGHPWKIIGQIQDAAQSISANIAEGYCRKSIKEYLNFLNIALGSAGELYSRCYACHRANQIRCEDFDQIDSLHYEVENLLLRLIESLQEKQQDGDWQDSFLAREERAEYYIE